MILLMFAKYLMNINHILLHLHNPKILILIGFVKVIHGTVSRIVMEKVMFYMIKHLEDL